MKGFYIEITNNLLEPKHRKKMGSAVWEFMWCLDKITKINGEQLGWVCGGKPIQLKEIKEEIGITEPKISKNLNKLMKEGYLILLRVPRGLVIKVCKAKKRFAQKVKSDLPKRENHTIQKGKSNIRQDIDKTIRQDNIIIKNLKNGRRVIPVGDPPEWVGQKPNIGNLKKLAEMKKPIIEKMKMR